MKTFTIFLLSVLCLVLSACGNKGSLVLPTPTMDDAAVVAEPAEAEMAIKPAAKSPASPVDAVEEDESLPEPPPPPSDDGDG